MWRLYFYAQYMIDWTDTQMARARQHYYIRQFFYRFFAYIQKFSDFLSILIFVYKIYELFDFYLYKQFWLNQSVVYILAIATISL